MRYCPNCGFHLEEKETLIKYKIIEKEMPKEIKEPKKKTSFDKFRDFATEWTRANTK